MRRALSLAVAAVVVASACQDRHLPTGPLGSGPSLAIVDGRNDASRPGFFFLAPIRPLSLDQSHTGPFNPNLSPVVEICEWTGGACVLPLVSRLTMTTGQALDRVFVIPQLEEYSVLWRTDNLGLSPTKTYRIRVLTGNTELGFADIDVVRTIRELTLVNRSEFVPLLKDLIFPIRFRIEGAAPAASDDAYQTVLGATFNVPAGAGPPPGLLANDELGSPSGAVSSFGAGSLGGDVTDHGAGASTSFAGGTLTVNADGSFALLQPSTAGLFTFKYRIGNARGTSDGTVSVTVRDNQAPSAIIAAPLTVPFGQAFTLSGAESSDAGGGTIVKYIWTLPGGGVVEETDPVLDVPGTLALGLYTYQLEVVDNAGNRSQPDQARLRVVDASAPTAILTAPRIVPFGEAFTLSGAESSDAGGGSISQYAWTLPDGELVVTVDPVLHIPGTLALGLYTYQLEVVDNAGNRSQPDQARLMVVDASAPTAIITAPSTVPFGEAFTLSGAASSDAGGGTVVHYIWTLPDGEVVEALDPVLHVPGTLAPGSYLYQLIVQDNAGNYSQPVTARVDVVLVDNQAPRAIITAPHTVPFGQAFTLSGAESSDVGGGTIVRYIWTLPDGSVVEETDPVLDVPGTLALGSYTYQLEVLDNSGNRSHPVFAHVFVVDVVAPTAILTAPRTVPFGEAFTLSGAESSDAGGGSIHEYVWTLPDGEIVVTADPVLHVAGTLALGHYRYQLEVVDNSGNRSQPDQAIVIVVDALAPTAVLTAPSTVPFGEALSGAASSDAGGGTVVHYFWVLPDGEVVETLDPVLHVPGTLAAGSYVYQLVVEDNSGNRSQPATATVDVVAVN